MITILLINILKMIMREYSSNYKWIRTKSLGRLIRLITIIITKYRQQVLISPPVALSVNKIKEEKYLFTLKKISQISSTKIIKSLQKRIKIYTSLTWR